NGLLRDLVTRCTRAGEVQNYVYISVLGYGATVGPALAGPLSSRELVPIADLAASPARMGNLSENVGGDAGGLKGIQAFPVWLEPAADGGTPMSKALRSASRIIEHWISEHPNGFPPTVLH